jgi:AcrR family transcriptional regulator
MQRGRSVAKHAVEAKKDKVKGVGKGGEPKAILEIDLRSDIDAWADLLDDQEPVTGNGGAEVRGSSLLRRTRTRRRILKAGREIFAVRGFGSPRVDDVTNAAGVSRATFYLHFKSLDELVMSVFRREVRWQLRRYHTLTSEIVTNERKLRGWLKRFLASYRRERDYIVIIYRALTINTGHLNFQFATNQEMIEDMARRIPEFALYDQKGEHDEKRRLALYQLMRSLSDVSLHSAFDSWGGDMEFVIERLAGAWIAFANEGNSKPD